MPDFIGYISNPAFGLNVADQGFNDDPDGDRLVRDHWSHHHHHRDSLGGYEQDIPACQEAAELTIAGLVPGKQKLLRPE